MDKTRTVKLLDDTFRNNFDISQFSKFIKELFNEIQINVQDKTPSIENQFKEYIAECKKIAEYKDISKKSIEILAVKLKRTSSRDRARTMQRNFISSWLDKQGLDVALVAFYVDNNEDWRFSYVKLEYNLIKNEEDAVIIEKELTPAKRYSFLVGINEPNHTCQKQFLDLIMEEKINPSINEIEQAFSIEKVTKEFFEKYKELAIKLMESMDKILAKDFRIKSEFDNKGISTIDFSKKLLGQIVFIYFLQKKGWLGVPKNANGKFGEWGTGPKKFLRKLFDGQIVPYNNFFNDILEPLFYEALANDRSADNEYYSRFKCKIPFLNGGLFEPLNDYNWTEIDIKIPNERFSNSDKTETGDIGTGILDVFERYNFTVREDEPLEKEVAVDPEMLGKVFENLLEIKERKDKGAFYTPREIVHFMCQQSIIKYLETNTNGVPREDIERFIQYGDIALDQTVKSLAQIETYRGKSHVDAILLIPKSIINNYQMIDKLLQNIKIVDPAVGSGAFPVGMMNEIIKARSILTLFFPPQEQEFRTDYNLKRQCIENCLYGVDIDPSAIEIAKLRFWLSLIVDEEMKENIHPLPNLDHKLMCGNSLLEEFEGIKLFDERLLGEFITKRPIEIELEEIENQISHLNRNLSYVEFGDQRPEVRDNVEELEALKKKKSSLERKLEKEKQQKNKEAQVTIDQALEQRIRESQIKLSKLKKFQKEFFNEQDRTKKKKLRAYIEKIECELIEATLKEQGHEEALIKFEQYNKTNAKPFFLWKLYFAEVFQRENPGFDVVIANPPYLSSKDLNKNNDADALRSTFGDIDDLYSLFLRLVPTLIRMNGILSYIVPNTFMTLVRHNKIRNMLRTEFSTKILDLNPKVFEAYVFNAIIISVKGPPSTYLEIGYADNLNNLAKCAFKNLSYEETKLIPNEPFFYPTEWYYSHDKPIIDKLSLLYKDIFYNALQNSKKYNKYKIEIHEKINTMSQGDFIFLGLIAEGAQGLVTGNNSLFIGIFPNNKEEKSTIWNEYIKRLSQHITINNENIEYSRNNAKKLYNMTEILKKEHKKPSLLGKKFIYRIISFEDIIQYERLSDTEKNEGLKCSNTWIYYHRGNESGDRWIVQGNEYINWSYEKVSMLKNKDGTNSRWQGQEFFFKNGFGWVDYFSNRIKGFYVEPTVYSKNVVKFHSYFVDDLYLLALINSSYIAYFVKKYITNTRTLQINDGKLIPVLIPSTEKMTILVDKVKKIMEAKKIYDTGENMDECSKRITLLEKEIDCIIFQLYGFENNPDYIGKISNYLKMYEYDEEIDGIKSD